MAIEFSSHYDAAYFQHQAQVGQFGGWANLPTFSPFVSETDDVLDFGCGGGYLLRNLKCRSRIGVEVNPDAARVAKANGIEVFQGTRDVPDASVDVVISNHALEHTLSPLQELRSLHTKLKPGGRLVIVVPSESVFREYRPGDKDRHLFTWSPMNLGNLLEEAGFHVISSEAYVRRWPPKVHRLLARLGGRYLFDASCRIYGRLAPSLSQVRAIATKT